MVYNGALNGSLDGGNIIFRGHRATMKLNRDGFAVYPEGKVQRELTQLAGGGDGREIGCRRHDCAHAEFPGLRTEPEGSECLDPAGGGDCARRASGQYGVAQGDGLDGLTGSAAGVRAPRLRGDRD